MDNASSPQVADTEPCPAHTLGATTCQPSVRAGSAGQPLQAIIEAIVLLIVAAFLGYAAAVQL